VTLSQAEIEKCDFSNPKDGYIDGWDLTQFAAYYAAGDLMADVNGDGVVDSADVAHFAGFFGARRPNILLIVADDVGVDVASNLYPGLIDSLAVTYGSGVRGNPASLPVLTDRLATQGMVFANAWAQPYCSPTRATVISGLFEDKTQVKAPDNPMSINHTTFVKKLKEDGGYSTAIFGKWHLAGSSPGFTGAKPKQVGFDLFKGNLQAAINTFWNYTYHVQDDATSATTFRTDPTPTKSLPSIAATTYAPVVKGADTIEWINARHTENPDKPWFVWLAFNLSHVTISTSPNNMIVPNADTLETVSYNEMLACGGTFGTANTGSCTGKQLMRAMTNSMDTVIGKVLDAVEPLGPNTYVIFIGDNGTPMYGGTSNPDKNFIDNMYITRIGRGKGTAYQSGCRVPMAIRGPNIAAGLQSSESVHVADLFATILTLAGLTPPATNLNNTGATVDSDSKSLTPILFGSASAVRDPYEGYLLTETSLGSYRVGARNATYKVVCGASASNCTLYNLVTDPLEESPLTHPSSCTNYRSTYTTGSPEWQYCRLIEVVNGYSIFP
jgi:arylsulfatase A-like enzyme